MWQLLRKENLFRLINYGTKDTMQTSFLESCLLVIQIEVNYTEIIVARLDVRGEIFSILSSFILQSVLCDNFWGKKIKSYLDSLIMENKGESWKLEAKLSEVRKHASKEEQSKKFLFSGKICHNIVRSGWFQQYCHYSKQQLKVSLQEVHHAIFSLN